MAVPVYALGLDGTAAVRVLLVVQVLCYGGALALVALDRAPGPSTAGRGSRLGVRRRRPGRHLVHGDRGAGVGGRGRRSVHREGLRERHGVGRAGAVRRGRAGHRRRPGGAGSCRRGTPTGPVGDRAAAGRWLLLARTDAVLLLAVMGLWALAEARSGAGGASVVPLRASCSPCPAVPGRLPRVEPVCVRAAAADQRADQAGAAHAVGRVIWFVVAVLLAALIGVGGAIRRSRGRRCRGRGSAGSAASPRRPRGSPRSACCWSPTTRSSRPSSGSGTTARWRSTCCSCSCSVVADFAEAAVVEAPAMASPARAVLPVSAILLLPLVAGIVLRGTPVRRPARLLDRHRRP